MLALPRSPYPELGAATDGLEGVIAFGSCLDQGPRRFGARCVHMVSHTFLRTQEDVGTLGLFAQASRMVLLFLCAEHRGSGALIGVLLVVYGMVHCVW